MIDTQHSAFDKFINHSHWQPVFIVQTTRDLYFYESFPFSSHQMAMYKSSWPLMQTRLIYQSISSNLKNLMSSIHNNRSSKLAPSKCSSKSSSLSSLHDVSKMSIASSSSTNSIPIKFALRIGTSLGIQTKIFCAQSYTELSKFSTNLIKTTHNSVRKLQIITFRKYYIGHCSVLMLTLSVSTLACMNGNSESTLVLNYKEGIRISETFTGKVTHRIPFGKLHSTSDDGNKTIDLNYDTNSKVLNFDS